MSQVPIPTARIRRRIAALQRDFALFHAFLTRRTRGDADGGLPRRPDPTLQSASADAASCGILAPPPDLIARMRFEPDPDQIASQPLERAHALAAAFYTEPDAQAFERRQVFARHWHLLAHVSQLAASGDHVVGEVAGIPVIAVRGEDGMLRAMHNVCRHRAGPLATCDGRGARALRCRYHGWTYTLAGQLRSAPEMGDALDFDPSRIQLQPLQLETWRGLVFVALEPAHPLHELMRGTEQRLGERDFSGYVFAGRDSFEVACNWKVYVDNYLEGYHVPHIHPVLNKLLDYRSYVTEARHWHSLQYSPIEGGELYGDGEALYYFLWPNIMLNILPNRMQTNRVIPLGIDRCRVEFDYLYPAGGDVAESARRADDRRFSAEVQHEDGEICAAVQQRLACGAYQPGRLNPKRENAVHHFHELVRRSWRER
jgi:choline monooxygenase